MKQLFGVLVAGWVLSGCSVSTPTQAHTHIGHAITGAYNTPGEVGYFELAEARASEVLSAAERVMTGTTLETRQGALRDTRRIALGEEGASFSFAGALKEAMSHIQYASESADASSNVVRSVSELSSNTRGVTQRLGLMDRYMADALSTSDAEEFGEYARLIRELCYQNVHGADVDGNGQIGNASAEYGMRQLRADLDAMIAREEPAYTTVGRWYLFNLIRMPSGAWIFREPKPGESRGY